MSVVVKWSVILAVAITALNVIWPIAGLHTSILVGGTLFIALAMALNIWTLFMALKATAPQNGYGAQFLNALMFGLVAGVLVFASSWIVLAYIFPDCIPESTAAMKEFLQGSGLPQDQIDAQIAALEESGPMHNARSGAIGTLVTSLIAGAIIAIFKRRK